MRLGWSLLAGLTAAFALFLLMQSLIAHRDPTHGDAPRGAVVDFVRLAPEEIVARKERSRPPPPPPPARRPPPPRLAVPNTDKPPPTRAEFARPEVRVPAVGGTGPFLGGYALTPGSAEGDVIPIVRIAPRYPREARMRGAEGWVRVRFTINADGTVSNARVEEAEPRRLFDREAVRAILRWKFKPRIVDGVAVEREAEQVIEFRLGEG